jgi:hypothetical protein
MYYQDRSLADRLWEYINHSQIHECGNWETEHYNSVLEIKRPRSFISGNTQIGTKHLYWILTTLQRHNDEKLKQIFPEKEYRGLSPNFNIHVSVSELYIHTMGLPILL